MNLDLNPAEITLYKDRMHLMVLMALDPNFDFREFWQRMNAWDSIAPMIWPSEYRNNNIGNNMNFLLKVCSAVINFQKELSSIKGIENLKIKKEEK